MITPQVFSLDIGSNFIEPRMIDTIFVTGFTSIDMYSPIGYNINTLINQNSDIKILFLSDEIERI